MSSCFKEWFQKDRKENMGVRQGREGDKCRAESLGDHVGISRWSHRRGMKAAVHHWLRAASKLAAQDKHHFEQGENAEHSATGVHEEKPQPCECVEIRGGCQGTQWGFDSFSLRICLLH